MFPIMGFFTNSSKVFISLFCIITNLSLLQALQFDAALSRCPLSCDVVGPNPSNWTYYHDFNNVINCNQTLLLELNVHNDVIDQNTHLSYRSCAVSSQSFASANTTTISKRNDIHKRTHISKRQLLSFNTTTVTNLTVTNTTVSSNVSADPSSNSCSDQNAAVPALSDIQFLSWGQATNDGSSLALVVDALAQYLQLESDCAAANTPTNLIARSGSTIAGVFVGSQVKKQSGAAIVEKLKTTEISASQIALQLCDTEVINQRNTEMLGFFVDTGGSLSAVQKALKNWNIAQCYNGSDDTVIWQDTPVSIIPGQTISVIPTTGPSDNSTIQTARLVRRDTCSYTQAQPGDGCWSLAQTCGITQEQLEDYNGGPDFCNNVPVGQYVCCSSGSLPDFSPQPQPDGSCTTYTVQSGDTCGTIASGHTMTVDDITARNTQTWAWMGCQDLLIGAILCLSTGTPPMPAPLSGKTSVLILISNTHVYIRCRMWPTIARHSPAFRHVHYCFSQSMSPQCLVSYILSGATSEN
jgi:chitinase